MENLLTGGPLLFLGSLGLPEVLVIALVVLLLVGGKKIPELMKGLGKGVRSFKEGVKGVEDEFREDLNEDGPDSRNSGK